MPARCHFGRMSEPLTVSLTRNILTLTIVDGLLAALFRHYATGANDGLCLLIVSLR